jgi:chondroitin AC lyase
MPKEDVSDYVFELGILHGAQPVKGSYAYGISPAAKAAREPFEILSNTEQLQAVRFNRRLVGAVFHAPGRFEYAPKRFVEVDSPCVLLLADMGDRVRATVADPTQKLKSLGIALNGKKHTLQLPAGGEAGNSVAVQ